MRYRLGSLVLDVERRALCDHAGRPILIRSLPLALLVLLVEHDGELVSYAEIRKHVWQGRAVSSDALYQCVRDLKKVLGHRREAPAMEVVYGRGLRLRLELERLASGSSPDSALRGGWPPAVWRNTGPRVLVLPLRGRDPGADELGERLAERIGLLLLSEASVLDPELRQAPEPLDRAELVRMGVEFAVTGTVRRVAGAMHCSARWMRTSSGRAVGRPVRAAGATLEETALGVAARLGDELMRSEMTAGGRRSALTPYQHMLACQARLARLGSRNVQAARTRLDLLARAALPPRRVHLWRSLSYFYDYSLEPRAAQNEALDAIEECLEQDGPDSGVHAVHGVLLAWSGSLELASTAADHAALDDAHAHRVWWQRACVYLANGRGAAAVALLEQSLALVPDHPWAFHTLQSLACAHALEGDLERARDAASRSRRLHRAFPEALLWSAIICGLSGRQQKGRMHLARLQELVPLPVLAAFRPARGQGWEPLWHRGLAALGIASVPSA